MSCVTATCCLNTCHWQWNSIQHWYYRQMQYSIHTYRWLGKPTPRVKSTIQGLWKRTMKLDLCNYRQSCCLPRSIQFTCQPLHNHRMRCIQTDHAHTLCPRHVAQRVLSIHGMKSCVHCPLTPTHNKLPTVALY